MPAPPNRTYLEGRIVDNHDIELQTKTYRAVSAFYLLDTYDFNGSGPMPAFTWDAPDGGVYTYTPGLGELEYDGAIYSSLNSVRKRKFFLYLSQFMAACMKRYDEAYNL